MQQYRFTAYVENEVLRKRLYLQREWCIRVIEHPLKTEPQEHNRYRFWAAIEELAGRMLRVVILADKITIHNAFPDRYMKMMTTQTTRCSVDKKLHASTLAVRSTSAARMPKSPAS